MQDPSYGKPLGDYIDFEEFLTDKVLDFHFVKTDKEEALCFFHEYNKEYGNIERPYSQNYLRPENFTLKEIIEDIFIFRCSCPSLYCTCYSSFFIFLQDLFGYMEDFHISDIKERTVDIVTDPCAGYIIFSLLGFDVTYYYVREHDITRLKQCKIKKL